MHEDGFFFLFCSTTFRRDGGVAAVILKPANPEDVNENVSRLREENVPVASSFVEIRTRLWLRVTRGFCDAIVT